MMDSKGGEDGPTDFSRRGICRRIACMDSLKREGIPKVHQSLARLVLSMTRFPISI
jgi:hypothetical protein